MKEKDEYPKVDMVVEWGYDSGVLVVFSFLEMVLWVLLVRIGKRV